MTDKKEEMKEEKENKISTLIAVLVVLAISIIVVVALTSSKEEEGPLTDEYNGFTFIQDNNGFWHTTLRTIRGDADMPFRHHPSDVDMFSYDDRINERISIVQSNGGRVMIVFDDSLFDSNLTDVRAPAVAGVEIGKITSNVLGMVTESGVTSPVEGADDLQVINCSMSSTKLFVFEFRLGEEGSSSRVYNENFCAVIRANQLNDTIKLADLISYKLIGIIPSN